MSRETLNLLNWDTEERRYENVLMTVFDAQVEVLDA